MDEKAAYLQKPSENNEEEWKRVQDDYDSIELNNLLYERVADFSFNPGDDM